MSRPHGYRRTVPCATAFAAVALISTVPPAASARSAGHGEILSEDPGDRFLVGARSPAAKTALSDTVWIADWSFDAPGGGCIDTGWTRYDNRILNDGSNYWTVDDRFDGTGGITGKAAVLSKHDLQWARDGYGNSWDYALVAEYQGNGSTLTLDYLSDCETGFDFISVEADSAGLSTALVDYSVDPSDVPSNHRTVLLQFDGLHNGTLGPLVLPDFGAPGTTHRVYVRFVSDGGYSDEDGLYASAWNAGLVVDNVVLSGGLAYGEDFETTLDPKVSLVNTAVATPFGQWARLYPHITDNDQCTENTTCAWLWSDPTLPAYFPDMAFGPGGTVLRNWLDDTVVSPWIGLGSTSSAAGTLLCHGIFGGTSFGTGRIVFRWSVRSKVRLDNTDTSATGDSVDLVAPWEHNHSSLSVTSFAWLTRIGDMTPYIDSNAVEIQVRLRAVDYQVLAGTAPPTILNTGPGPFVDHVKVGRRVLSGPLLTEGNDSRTQAQDCFASAQNSITPGEHFSPSTDLFGTAAFSSGADLGSYTSPNLITGDSITIRALDARGAGGVTAVRVHGAIVDGPHAGKAPAPYATGPDGFFVVMADSARNGTGAVVADTWFVDLDDSYFRGGDRMLYFWSADDALGGYASDPGGMTSAPSSIAEAELLTGGLLEVSFLPTINWDPGYVARIAADAHGDLDPAPAELAGSLQSTCILYVQQHATRRRSGDTNRTAFMYTLDLLGYRGHYDVYDVQGYGNTNNQLGGRATVDQCTGYALVVQDNGRGLPPNLPNGSYFLDEKVDQTQWYRDYLAQGIASPTGGAALWLVGEDIAVERSFDPLVSTDLGLAQVVDSQGVSLAPDVDGQSPFTFSNGNVASFAGDAFVLSGRCVSPGVNGPAAHADYDGAESAGTAVVTHRYVSGATTGSGAIAMNKNDALHWNTIWMGFGWFDVHDASGEDPSGDPPTALLARKILDAVLPEPCVEDANPTDVGRSSDIDALPRVTALHANVPNPFNPTTTIHFDLAADGPVALRLYDVSGRLVRTLWKGDRTRGRHAIVWNGLDEHGTPVASGVYLCRLATRDASMQRKLLLIR